MAPEEKLEERLARDEQRLAFDEARLNAEGEAIHENAVVAKTGMAVIVVLAVAVVALVVGVVALQRDINALDRPAPEDSVSTDALQDHSVTAGKLADGAVIRAAIVDGAIGPLQLAPDSVSGAHVASTALTGADISESTLGTVPHAQRAADASRLGGHSSAAFVARVENVSARTLMNTDFTKGPLAARCPAGKRIVSGGATVDGRTTGVSLVSSAPDGDAAWTATARARTASRAWRLTVTAICASGGR
jgi:hypothetical protein